MNNRPTCDLHTEFVRGCPACERSDMALPLFEPRKLSHRSDPETSRAAAASCGDLRREHHLAILDALERAERPLAAEEIAGFCDLTPLEISRRTAELRRDGLIEDSGERHKNMSGRSAVRYRRSSRIHEVAR